MERYRSCNGKHRGTDVMKKLFSPLDIFMAMAGAFIMAFGLFEVHSFSSVTEGGVLGATLLLDHHFGISPAISSLVLNVICYVIGWRILGKRFMIYSAIATLSFSLSISITSSTSILSPI